jgi:hypothetical protein
MRSADYGDVALGVECAWPVPGVRLARGAIVRMRDAAGTTVSAHQGLVWITEEKVEAWTDAALSFSAGD